MGIKTLKRLPAPRVKPGDAVDYLICQSDKGPVIGHGVVAEVGVHTWTRSDGTLSRSYVFRCRDRIGWEGAQGIRSVNGRNV